MEDPYNLERFVAAQNDGGTYDRAVGELKRGRKSSHWMWFVFPQIAGLGQSSMSRTYAISSLDEAKPNSPIPCSDLGCWNARAPWPISKLEAPNRSSAASTPRSSAPR